MNPERSERIEIPVYCRCAMWWFIRTWSSPYLSGGKKSIRCLEAAMDHDKNYAGRAERSFNG